MWVVVGLVVLAYFIGRRTRQETSGFRNPHNEGRFFAAISTIIQFCHILGDMIIDHIINAIKKFLRFILNLL